MTSPIVRIAMIIGLIIVSLFILAFLADAVNSGGPSRAIAKPLFFAVIALTFSALKLLTED